MHLPEHWVWILTLASALMFVGSLFALPFFVVRIPEDYFIRRPVHDWPTQRPLLHLLGVIVKNIAGVILILAGLTMLVLPGQGLLTILAGLVLVDFPGKRYWERRLIGIRPVRDAANWIRRRYGRPPLKIRRDRSK